MKLSLLVLDETFAISTLKKDEQLPGWATSSAFFSITRTYDELSIVCPQKNIPAGILASLSMPLASEGISIFVFSSYDTDHIMVKQYELDKAIEVLQKAGHSVQYQLKQ
jgi:hypothetical protein